MLIAGFQNCSQFGVSSQNSAPTQTSSDQNNGGTKPDGNGQGYDGKIRIVQHFDTNEKYFCKDQEVPKSILYQKSILDGWYYIKNYKEPCQSAPAVKVTGVIYDDSIKKATYQGLVYLAPKPILVNSLEDANTSDSNIYDGVCQNARGLCSLKAAIEQASANVTTQDVSVQLPAGLYKLNQPLELHLPFSVDGHKILLNGENLNNTLIDGQNLTDLLVVDGDVGSAHISNITFQNGINNKANHGSAITLSSYFNAEINITNCKFNGNDKNSDLAGVLSGGQINVRQSQFTNNKSKFASAIKVFGSKLLVEDTIISNNAGLGIIVENRTYDVNIRRTSIFENGSIGIYLYECKNCSIENSTLYHNQGGLMVTTVNPATDSTYNVVVKNSTFVSNSNASYGNLDLNFAQATTQLLMSNSVIATLDPTFSNCTSSKANHQILSVNNLFDDLSCSILGSNNITQVDPKLSSLQQSTGLTPTMLPLAGSPLIDAGDNASCAVSDQRGLARPIEKLGRGAVCDIGAIEIQ